MMLAKHSLQEVHLEIADRCKKFSTFIRLAWPVLEQGTPLIWNWHIDCMADHLEAMYYGQITRLVANIAPGCMKSSVFSVMWPAWVWTLKPETRLLCASHSLDLALRDSSNCRTLIESEWYQSLFGHMFKMDDTNNAKSFFANDHRGSRRATSVGAKGTGKRAGVLLIDDSNDAKATRADLDNTTRWFAHTWLSRLDDMQTGVMAVVGQRISDRDLTATILKELGGWEHLVIPMEYEPKRKFHTSIGWTDKRTYEGELLWPEKFPHSALDTLKKGLGSINYSAQYQQSPTPSEGGTFKERWIRYFEEISNAYILHTPNGDRSVLKDDCWRFTVVDLAVSERQTADYTVIQTYDVTPQNDLLLIDQVRDRMDSPTQQKTLRLVYATFKPRFMKIESVGYQLSTVQELRDVPTELNEFIVSTPNPEALDRTIRQLVGAQAYLVKENEYINIYKQVRGGYYIARVLGDKDFFVFAVEHQGYCKIIDKSELNKFSIPLKEYRPPKKGGDKVTRAIAPAIQMENGKMYFRQGAHYLTDLIAEMLLFPKGAHDDCVDCLSQAADEIVQPQGIIAWSVDVDTSPIKFAIEETSDMKRAIDLTLLPENNPHFMEIEKWDDNQDEGEWFDLGENE